MLTLIIGGSGSGKSAFAEKLSAANGAGCIYLATMEPFGEEGRARISRHRLQRGACGFRTLERYTDLAGAPVPPGSDVLLEDLSNLLANEMFSPAGAGDGALTAVRSGIDSLLERCRNLLIVTNEVFSGGSRYEGETIVFLDHLAALNREIAARADLVVEIVCGIPNVLKGRLQAEAGRETLNGMRSERPDVEKTEPLKAQQPEPADMRQEKQPDAGQEKQPDAGQEKQPDAGQGKQPDLLAQKPLELLREQEKNTMIFVTGPLFAGKQEYIQNALGMDDASFAACAVRDVQDLVFPAADSESGPGPMKSGEAGSGEPVSGGKERAVSDFLKNRPGGAGSQGFSMTDLTALADRLSRKKIVIATEVGGGVVPTDPGERAAREAAGRLSCLLAARADTVIRVCCGLPQLLKGEWP